MANTIGFGQAAVNNTIDYGQGAIDNTINWGKSQTLSPSGETNITGTPDTPSFSNLNSFSFDGIDEYFIGTSTYSELDGQNKATISFWIKPTSVPNYKIIASVIRNATTSNHQFQIELTTARTLQFSIDSSSKYIRSASTPLTLSVWTHVMYCVDTTLSGASRGRVFINGVDSTSTSSVGGTFSTSIGALYIGEKESGQYHPFSGFIDEFAIWSGTDQRANVSEIYGGGQVVDLNNLATVPQPTTWQRMGDNATWNGATWTMTDVNGGYTNRSIFMVEANRSTDVPT